EEHRHTPPERRGVCSDSLHLATECARESADERIAKLAVVDELRTRQHLANVKRDGTMICTRKPPGPAVCVDTFDESRIRSQRLTALLDGIRLELDHFIARDVLRDEYVTESLLG